MSQRPWFSPVLEHIGGVPIRELVQRFGTPLYVYDAETIVRRWEQLRRFPVVRYAQKACSNLAVLALLRRQGVVLDAVSAGEIVRALRAGYPAQGDPPPVVYTADIFDRPALELVARHGIHVNCGSPDMMDQLAQAAGGQEITLRINPGFGHGHSQKTNTGGEQSKHGIWHEQLPECLRRAEQLGHRVVGLHVHIGSGTDLEHLAQVCQAMEQLAQQAGPHLRTISAGGGLPVPYRPEDPELDLPRYHQLWEQTCRRIEQRLGHPVRLEIEPGRFLVAESGYLLTEIRAVKQQGSRRYWLVDAGFNDLARPVMYGAYHPMSVCRQDGSQEAEPVEEVAVGGPLCESGDIFTQEEGGFVVSRRLPRATVGDLLVIGVAGAYGAVMGSNYNSKPLAAEVLVLEGTPHLVRRRQGLEELFAGEQVPEALADG